MDKQYYKEYAELEKSHWWFTARLKILERLFKRSIAKKSEGLKILNAGVASGMTSIMLQQFGDVTSLEYDKDCCDYLINEVGLEVTNGSLTALPYESNSFDVVCAFDVIEHIEDHALAMSEINRVLKTGGTTFITVPAYNFLWSEHDEINHHMRRYTKKTLLSVLTKFKVQYVSYFNFFLFPPVVVARFLHNILSIFKKKKALKSDFETYKSNSIVNKILYRTFLSERSLLGKVHLPFGVSICAICVKEK